MSTTLRFTVAEYDRMIEEGIFSDRPHQRLELIYGEIREMPAPNPDHEETVDLLNYWSIDHTHRDQVRVRIQNSIGIAELDCVPQPDVAWLRAKSYRKKRPQAGDVLLVIEVSDTTLSYDRGEKAGLYAAAGISDFWIINLRAQTVEVFRKPRGGKYREVKRYGAGQKIRPLAVPSASLDVTSVFGHERSD
jgi:Uma2 family endonuclease